MSLDTGYSTVSKKGRVPALMKLISQQERQAIDNV